MTENKAKRYSITVDKELHKNLKIRATENDRSMKAEIKSLLDNSKKPINTNDTGGGGR